YLEDLAAEESGVDKVYIDKARELIGTAIENAHTGGGGGLPDWITSDDGFRPMRITMTVTKNPAFTTPDIPNDLVFETPADSDYYDTEVQLPAQALLDGKSVRIPVQFIPNLTGLPRFQVNLWGTYQDVPPLTQELLENSWFTTRNNTPCHTFAAMGKLVGEFGGSKVTLGYAGYQLLWQIPTHPGFVSDDPNLSACP
ncbi:MAG TPA: hypothetical protein VFQ65_03180, partial [Kofleriaceae bacterium]|nr:hypothetical protein [Kofleriaceae bacterium]